MDETQANSGLYIATCTEKNSSAQPISTALSLDAGKNLCLQHFLKRCRTVLQRLAPEQGMEIISALPTMLSLTWSQSPGGGYEGQPEGHLATPLASMTSTTYQLRLTE